MKENVINSYLTFLLQGELFAVSVKKVLEIIETDEEHSITLLPKAPPAIKGVVNFRGDVIPVVDTRMKFDLTPYNDDDRFVIIVLNLTINDKEHLVGTMADKVVDVVEIDENAVKPVPEVGQGYDSNYINGVVHRDGNFVMLLNLEAALGSNEIVSLNKKMDELETTEVGEEISSDDVIEK